MIDFNKMVKFTQFISGLDTTLINYDYIISIGYK